MFSQISWGSSCSLVYFAWLEWRAAVFSRSLLGLLPAGEHEYSCHRKVNKWEDTQLFHFNAFPIIFFAITEWTKVQNGNIFSATLHKQLLKCGQNVFHSPSSKDVLPNGRVWLLAKILLWLNPLLREWVYKRDNRWPWKLFVLKMSENMCFGNGFGTFERCAPVDCPY